MDHDTPAGLDEALQELRSGEEMARYRVWNRVREGVQRRRRRQRQARWSAAAAAVAAIAMAAAIVQWPGGSGGDSTRAASAIAPDDVWAMLAAQPGADASTTSLEQFVLSIGPSNGEAGGLH